MRIWFLVVVLAMCHGVPTRAIVGGAAVAPEATAVDAETVRGSADYLAGWPAREGDSVNAVIEIPAGTVAKFEVTADGELAWEHAREGGLRAVDFLPYPVNYGMVPCTLAADGDPIDIVVLGRAMERGHVASVRIIGVLEMRNGEVRDDKLVAVPREDAWRNGFSELTDLGELDAHYPAARELIETWFASYWGPGATEVVGWGDVDEAERALDEAITCTLRS